MTVNQPPDDKVKNPLEIYKLLPKTNCGSCYVPTCLAFAAAIIKGDKQLADCPGLAPDVIARFNGKISVRAPMDRQRAGQLDALKARIAAIDLVSAAPRLGGEMISGKLAISCLGKRFLVEPTGAITSECHTHAGLAIPLLSYILDSRGDEAAGTWVPFREIKDGSAMSPLFGQRCEKPLKNLADRYPDLFEHLISIFGGKLSFDHGYTAEIAIVLYPLPKLPMLICYSKPDEDLESELNIFFDGTAENHLGIESIYALAAGLVMMFEKIALAHG